MTDLASRITLYRARHDMSKVDFGLLVDVTGSTVCKWESGRNKPSYDNLQKLEAVLEDDRIMTAPGGIHWCDDLDGQLGMVLPEPIVLERDEPTRDWRSWAVIVLAAVLLGVLLTFTVETLA